jgi:hypothetical protein
VISHTRPRLLMADAELPEAGHISPVTEGTQEAQDTVAIEGPAADSAQEPAAKKTKHKHHKHKHKSHKSKDKKKSKGKDRDAASGDSPAAGEEPQAADGPRTVPAAAADAGAPV